MATVHHNRRSSSSFHGAILALLWAFELICLSTAVITLTLLIGVLKGSPMMYYSGEYSEDKLKVLPGTAPTPYIIMLAITTTLTILCGIEVSIYFHRDLTPCIFLYSTIFKCTSWLVVVGMNVWSISRPWLWNLPDLPEAILYFRIYLSIMLGGAVGVFLMFVLALWYAVSVFRKQKRYIRARVAEEGIRLS